MTVPLPFAEPSRRYTPWAVGHLQHGTLLLGIRALASHTRCPTSLHPERTKSQSKWTANDWGIHQANLIAGAFEASLDDPTLRIFQCNSGDLHAAVTPPGIWQSQLDGSPFHSSLKSWAQYHQHRQYTKKRDMKRIYANAPTRWTKYSAPLMATLTKSKNRSPRNVGRPTKLYDWMAHATNLAKGSLPQNRDAQSRSLRHNNISTRPAHIRYW
jgi:hypothetical protein